MNAQKKSAKKPAAKAKKPAAMKAPAKKPAAKKPGGRSPDAALKELLGPTTVRALQALANALVTNTKNKLSLNEAEAKAVAAALFTAADRQDAFVDLLRKAVKETQTRSSSSSTPTPFA